MRNPACRAPTPPRPRPLSGEFVPPNGARCAPNSGLQRVDAGREWVDGQVRHRIGDVPDNVALVRLHPAQDVGVVVAPDLVDERRATLLLQPLVPSTRI